VKKSGFTLIELMVAMVVGLTAITSVYALGAAMSQRFYEEQRLAGSQGTSRVAIMELRRDISRAGLFGSPNAQLEPTCGTASLPGLPKLGGGADLTMGAFQYYPDADLGVLDPDGLNAGVHADRLRVLGSLYLSDSLLVHSIGIDGLVIVLDTGNQAYRRTFSWGQSAGPFTTSEPIDYLTGELGWSSDWAAETESWKGIGQQGARAFQTGSVLHIETPEGRHFFRSVFKKGANVQNQVRLELSPTLPLPVGTACLPGAAEGSTITPLQWVEYAVVDPFDTSGGGEDFMSFDAMFDVGLDPDNPAFALSTADAGSFLESPNLVLVRRVLDSETGDVRPNSTQVIAQFVSHFRVSFLFDERPPPPPNTPPDFSAGPITGTDAESKVNARPERVRSVIIELGIRSPLEDPSIALVQSDAGVGTRFDVNGAQKGSARVRHMRIEIPVMNVARRNL